MTTRAPFLSGAETALKQLASGLADAGAEVMVICGQEGDAAGLYRDDPRLRVEIAELGFTSRFKPWRFFRCVRRLRALMRDHRAAVLHANDIPSYQAASRAAAGGGMVRVSHARFLLDQEKAAAWFLKFGFDAIISVSHYLKSHLLEKGGRVFGDRIVVSHDGLETPPPPTPEARAEARARLGIDAARAMFLFVGQFTPVKGLEELIPAIGRLPESVREGAEFHLVGDDLQQKGAYREAMMRLAAEQAPGASVHFPGFRRDVPDFLAAADAVVVPSRVDPLGMTAMESMAAGRAVIGARVGGIPEMVIHEQTGLLVEPGDVAGLSEAIARLAADRAWAVRLGEAGHAYACREYALAKHVREVLAIYRACAEGTLPALASRMDDWRPVLDPADQSADPSPSDAVV